MMVKFKRTGQLDILPGSGRKRVYNIIVKEIVTAVVEETCELLHETVDALTISRNLDMSYSTVQDIMHRFFKFLDIR